MAAGYPWQSRVRGARAAARTITRSYATGAGVLGSPIPAFDALLALIAVLRTGNEDQLELAVQYGGSGVVEHSLILVAAKQGADRLRSLRTDAFGNQGPWVVVAPYASDHAHGLNLPQHTGRARGPALPSRLPGASSRSAL